MTCRNDYASIYNTLYSSGYHADLDYSHAKELCAWLRESIIFDSILDVGCSNGWSLRYFKDRYAWGIDAAEKAVELCTESGCYAVQGCATKLPFGSKSFDIVISTDCLEHLSEPDVLKAVSEMMRVSKRYIAVKPAPRLDRARWKDIVGHNLHLCVKPMDWWRALFVDGEIIHEENECFVVDLMCREDIKELGRRQS